MKSIRTQSFSCLYFPHSAWVGRFTLQISAFSPDAGKYGPEKLWIQTLFTQFLFSIIAQLTTALKCYTGMVQNGIELSAMKIKQMDCAFGMNQCTNVDYEVNVLGLHFKATQAMCTSTALNCQICPVIKNALSSISKCDVSFIKCLILLFFSYYLLSPLKLRYPQITKNLYMLKAWL